MQITIKNISDAIYHPNTELGVILATVEQKRAHLAEWKNYEGKNIPLRLQQIIDQNRADGRSVWEYANRYYDIFYKGDLLTTDDWIMITNGGNYYKVGAKWSIWETRTYIPGREGLRQDKLFLGCEFGTYKNLVEPLSKYYFGINLIGREIK